MPLNTVIPVTSFRTGFRALATAETDVITLNDTRWNIKRSIVWLLLDIVVTQNRQTHKFTTFIRSFIIAKLLDSAKYKKHRSTHKK